MSKMDGPARITHYSLLILLVTYFALASLFALTTPPWQNPDEPAHYNYIAHIAETGRLPVLQMGDYDQAYLQRLKDARFPPELSVAPVRYEFHQPPLYYLLAAPVYWGTGGSLLALRLFTALLGGGVVVLIFLCTRTLFPEKPELALGAAAFAAFLPMHLSLMAAVNNDALAELLIAGGMLALLRSLRGGVGDKETGRQGDKETGRRGDKETGRQGDKETRRRGDKETGRQGDRETRWHGDKVNAPRTIHGTPHSTHYALRITLYSFLMGLGFLTKATAYVLLPVGLIVVVARVWGRQVAGGRWQAAGGRRGDAATKRRHDAPISSPHSPSLHSPNLQSPIPNTQSPISNPQSPIPNPLPLLSALLLPGLLLGSLWWVRNSMVYGGADVLGLAWHDQVVTGQPTTAGWIAAHGWSEYWARAWRFTFQSFWGVFGWMGVFMDGRVYTAMLIFSGISIAGVLDALRRAVANPVRLSDFQRWGLVAYALLLGGVCASYVWYNLGFIQHQGRYLFPALVVWSLLFAGGWRQALQPGPSRWIGLLLLVGGLGLAGTGLVHGALDKWTLLLLLAGAGTLLANGFLLVNGGHARRVRQILFAAPWLLLILLDVAIPFVYSMPQLGR